MDTTEQKYKKIVAAYRSPINSIISEYPISSQQLPQCRNLKYIILKQKLSVNLPYFDAFYSQTIQQIKAMINDKNIQRKILGLRLSRALPFIHRIKVIQNLENELGQMIQPSNLGNNSPTKANSLLINSNSEFSYQITSDLIELILSIYELSHFSDEIYFDLNQKIISLSSKTMQQIYSNDKNMVRNCYEVLRAIFMVFGPKQDSENNKLISKVINILIYNSSFVTNISSNQQDSINPSQKLRSLIMRCRQYQVRVRSRLLKGVCLLLTYIEDLQPEIYELATNQVFIILENISECDVHLDCFSCLKYLLSVCKIFYIRNNIVKRWSNILFDISFKKQYWQHFLSILCECQKTPLRLKYSISTSLLEYTRSISQQFSRFLLYNSSCKNLIEVNRSTTTKQSTLLMNIFLHGWFIDRINQENDLFRCQFLVSLLHQFFRIEGTPDSHQIHDLLSLCHRLLDWKCNSKEETYIPTIKFAFDIYLSFLKKAADLLSGGIEAYINQLIQRCNDQNINFLFKLKMITTLIKMPWYKENWMRIQNKLNLNFLQGQIKPFMMPKNPKPIFDYEYSITGDGQIESLKEIEYIKVVMEMLNSLPEVHEIQERVSKLVVDYHNYLSQLQVGNSNKDLIHCLLTLEADNFLSDCQKNFLLAMIDKFDHKGNNSQLTLGQNIVYSPYEQFNYDDQINVLGTMSAIQLSVKILPHYSYSSVFLQIKNHHWVSIPSLRIVVSSGVEKIQIPFQSCIIQIKIDRIGVLHFQVRQAEGTQLLLGSGQFKLRRKLTWQKVQHLNFIDGIKAKAYFKSNSVKDGTYLSYYFGEPILIKVLKACNEVVVVLSSRQIWNQMQQAVIQMIQQLTDGTALMF